MHAGSPPSSAALNLLNNDSNGSRSTVFSNGLVKDGVLKEIPGNIPPESEGNSPGSSWGQSSIEVGGNDPGCSDGKVPPDISGKGPVLKSMIPASWELKDSKGSARLILNASPRPLPKAEGSCRMSMNIPMSPVGSRSPRPIPSMRPFCIPSRQNEM